MSLLVWLPLNGNLKNRGLDSTEELTSHSVSYGTGHGGYCLNVNAVKTASGYFSSLMGLEKYSFSLWIKVSSDSPSAWADIFILGANHDGNTGNIRIEHTGTAGQAQIIYNKSTTSGNSTNSYYGVGSLGANASDKWAHIVVTNDGTTVTSYLNGAKLATKPVSEIYPVGSLTGDIILGMTGAKGSLSDIRVYDHVLSKKEIKELSKGLMLHWGFNEGSYETVTNVLANPVMGASITNSYGWDKTLHPRAISVSGWSVGFNSGVSSSGTKDPEKGYHAHWQNIDGIATMVFPKLNYSVSGVNANRWLGISTSLTNLNTIIGPSTTYTVSFEAMSDVEGSIVYGGYHYTKSGATSNAFNDGSFYAKNIPVGKWKRYAFTFTTLSTLVTTNRSQFYFYGHDSNSANGTTYVRNVQVEVGDTCHDILIGTKLKETKIYDTSGFQHDGIITGELFSAQSNVNTAVQNSKNYENKSYSASFNGSTYVCYDGILPIPDSYTITFWLNRRNGGHIIDWRAASGSELGVQPAYLNESTGRIQYYSSAGGSVYFNYVFNANTWYHVAIVVDATTATLYVNGVNQQTINATLPAGNLSRFHVGCRVSYSNIMNMNMRDLRLYSSVLSDSDIKEIYNIPYIIDKNQNVYIRELREGSGD